jgi:lipopolysaccharide export LptBFGC system permease protein LptF
MVLETYFFKRFFKYLLLINSAFTLLFNFIEFFEKFIRAKHVATSVILKFVCLNTPPSFFENIPVSSWLATCLIIKEFAQQNEWEILQILSINYKKLFNLFLLSGFITMCFCFIGKEKVTLELANKAEKFKLEKFKQNSQQKILNKWLTLSTQSQTENKTIFLYFTILDLKTNLGSGLTLIYMTPKFEIESVLTANDFEILPQEQKIFIPEGTSIEIENKIHEKIKAKFLEIPSLFSQLQLNISIPSLFFLAKNLISEKKILPSEIWNDLLAQLLKKLFFHLQVLLYPLLTLCLFLLFFHLPRQKWLFIFLPYPLFTLINIIVDTLSQKGYNSLFTIIPYLLLLLAILLCKKKLEKSS